MTDAERKAREAEFRRECGIADDEPLPEWWEHLPTKPPEVTSEMVEHARKLAERLRTPKKPR